MKTNLVIHYLRSYVNVDWARDCYNKRIIEALVDDAKQNGRATTRRNDILIKTYGALRGVRTNIAESGLHKALTQMGIPPNIVLSL